MITVREFSPGDGKEMSRIMYESFKVFLKERMMPKKSAEFYEQNGHVTNGQWGDEISFVAVDNDKIVGCIHIAANKKKSWGSFGPIGVDPACQSKGIGRLLFNKAMEFWYAMNISEIYTCVSSINLEHWGVKP